MSHDIEGGNRRYLSDRYLRSDELNQSRPMDDGSFLFPLLNIYDAQYLLKVNIGKCGNRNGHIKLCRDQSFMVLPDTGSGDFWIFSARCLTRPDWHCPPPLPPMLAEGDPSLRFLTRHLYNASLSTESRRTANQKQLKYGDGTTVETIRGTDSLTIPGQFLPYSFSASTGSRNSRSSAQSLTAFNDVRLEEAVNYVQPLAGTYNSAASLIADGVLGLGGLLADDEKDNNSFIKRYLAQYDFLPPFISFHLVGKQKEHLAEEQHNNWMFRWRRFLSMREINNSFMILGHPRWDRFSRQKSIEPPNWSQAPSKFNKQWLSTTITTTAGGEDRQWIVSLQSIGIARSGFALKLNNEFKWRYGAPALIDTGTSDIVLESDIWAPLAQVWLETNPFCRFADTLGGGESIIICPCGLGWLGQIRSMLTGVPFMPSFRLEFNKADELPNVDSTHNSIDTFPICLDYADLLVPIDSTKENYQPITTKLKSLLWNNPLNSQRFCTLSVRGAPVGSTMPSAVVLGSAYLRSVYSTFDLKTGRIAFAPSILSANSEAVGGCPIPIQSKESIFIRTAGTVIIFAGLKLLTFIILYALRSRLKPIYDKIITTGRQLLLPQEQQPIDTFSRLSSRQPSQVVNDETELPLLQIESPKNATPKSELVFIRSPSSLVGTTILLRDQIFTTPMGTATPVTSGRGSGGGSGGVN